METLENRVVNIEHDCAEATEEMEVGLVVENLFSHYVLLYLPNV